MTYDITRPQPQLFVARDFDALVDGLDELAARLSYKVGGVESLERARKAAVPTTSVLESGIQISGTLARYEADVAGNPIYLKFDGPVQLAFDNQELKDQGPEYHREGFSTVLGKVKGLGRSPAELSADDLKNLGFHSGARGKMELEGSGIVLEGILKNRIEKNGKNVVLAFEDCRVSKGAQTLFDPAWGTFDLACGQKVVSVFGGAADRKRYLAATGGFQQEPGKQKTNLTDSNRALNTLYARVREIRNAGKARLGELVEIHSELEKSHRADWLLRYELLELDAQYGLKSSWVATVRQRLDELAKTEKAKAEMISRGLELLRD